LPLSFFAWFTSTWIVRHNQRFSVEHYRLESTVGAGDQAKLLAEVQEVEHHRQGCPGHNQKCSGVFRWWRYDPMRKSIRTDKVA
jgi:hypothetical protein